MRKFSQQELEKRFKQELEILGNKGLLIDPTKRALELRPLVARDGKFLVSDFTGTQQLEDIRVRTDSLIDKPLYEQGITALLYRSKIWIKIKDPQERERLQLPPCDYTNPSQMKRALQEEVSFDISQWFGEPTELFRYNLPFMFQTLGCNFRDLNDRLGCYFCFVDEKNNCPEVGEHRGAWVTEKNIVDTYEAARSDQEWINLNGLEWIAQRGGLNHVRHSGGQPTLQLDLTLRIADEMKKRGLPIKLMYDSNLSTVEALIQWELDGTYSPDILRRLGSHGVKVFSAFKGTDTITIQSNTQSTLTLEQQFKELIMHVKAGEECFLYIYNPNPFRLNEFIDQGMDIFGLNFLPMLHLASINMYGPTEHHIRQRARLLGKDEDAYFAEQQELFNFMITASREVLDARCKREIGIGYKQIPRRDIAERCGGLTTAKL